MTAEGVFPKSDGDVLYGSEANTFFGAIPVGGIVAWHKDMTGVPALEDNFVECDGTVINNAKSPMNGETLPNLNASSKVITGNTTSGGTASTLSVTNSARCCSNPTSGPKNVAVTLNQVDMVWVMRIY